MHANVPSGIAAEAAGSATPCRWRASPRAKRSPWSQQSSISHPAFNTPSHNAPRQWLRRAVAAAPPGEPPGVSSAEAAPAPAQPALDISGLQVSVEFQFSVYGCCTLSTHSQLHGKEAQTAAVIAAAFVQLMRRQQALDAAVATARRQLPGVLDAAMLKEFDRMAAVGRQGAGMTLLGFGQLHALASSVAPDVCHEVEQQIIAAAADLQARNSMPRTRPADSGGSGVEFITRPGFDLPLAVAELPQWQEWVRRLRDAVIAWQQEQQEQQRQQKAAAPAAASSAPAAAVEGSSGTTASKSPVGASSANAAASKGNLVARFSTDCVSPDGHPMRQQLTITVAPPGGRQLVQQLSSSPAALYWYASLDPALLPVASALEPLRQHALEVAAWRHVRLDPDSPAAASDPAFFTCTLHPGLLAGAAAARWQHGEAPQWAAEQQQALGPGSVRFGGSAFDLKVLVYALSWMEGGELDSSSSRKGGCSPWFPSDGRIRLQRCASGSGGSGWWGRQTAGAAAAGAAGGGHTYRLQVWPDDQQQAADAAQAEPGAAAGPSQQAEQAHLDPQTAELSHAELCALMDCLDGFILQHPGFVRLQMPPTLSAPRPKWRQRLAAWLLPGSKGSDSSRGAQEAAGSSS